MSDDAESGPDRTAGVILALVGWIGIAIVLHEGLGPLPAPVRHPADTLSFGPDPVFPVLTYLLAPVVVVGTVLVALKHRRQNRWLTVTLALTSAALSGLLVWGPEQFDARRLEQARAGCLADSGPACAAVIRLADSIPERDAALERRCTLGLEDACFVYGRALFNEVDDLPLSDDERERTAVRALDLLERECDAGQRDACSLVSAALMDSRYGPPNPAGAARAYARVAPEER